MDQDPGITVGELLQRTYDGLNGDSEAIVVEFPHKITAEIADDSDWHRTRKGYMGYPSVRVVRYRGQEWLIGLGTACGSYPSEPYVGDIAAVPHPAGNILSPEDCARSFRSMLGEYFRDALLIGLSGGEIVTPDRWEGYRFGGLLQSVLESEVLPRITSRKRMDERYVSLSTLSPVVTRVTRYDPSVVSVLAREIARVLSS